MQAIACSRIAIEAMSYRAKRQNMKRTALRIAGGFVHGVTQMALLGQASAVERFPTSISATTALRNDWRKIGGDMRRAIEKEEQLVKDKA
ncbi:hypothetical protein [Microvirga sp. KLBC 81]|uniref:hypothetical protein n=1 Tax=Microvirga sp. KLBC 81 TaxID=1862707 RepID=UPI0014032ED2|nr:hypothetical protein [Microvirga sp. KLBC 81]